jgi:ATP-dependent DNA ligase
MVFDLLYLKGKPLLGLPLSQRREASQRLFRQFAMAGVLVTEAVRERGRKLFEQVENMGLEGMMAKRLDGPYLPGKRSGHWLKIKTNWPPPLISPPAPLLTPVVYEDHQL